MSQRMGWKRDLPDYRDYKYAAHLQEVGVPELPVSVDLRKDLPPLKNQGSMGSCVSNALALSLEFIQLKSLNDPKEPAVFKPAYDPVSRLFVYYNARAIDGDVPYDNGTQIRSAMLGIKKLGICEETVWPYGNKYLFIKPTQPAYDEGTQHKIEAGYKIDHTNPTEMMACLASGHPFVMGVTLYSGFQSVAQDGMVSLPVKGQRIIGGHCMTVVGYDVSKSLFTVANSWGTGWGDQGFCYFPYEYLTNSGLAADFWTIRK